MIFLFSDEDFNSPNCVFLSVEITLDDATYRVSIADADPTEIPPPLRVDNISPAVVVFKQVRDTLQNTAGQVQSL